MPRILVVNDSSYERLLLRGWLHGDGHEPILAENGAIGLQRLAQAPDLALCDLEMPVLDGLGFLEALIERGCELPSLILCADLPDTVRARCRELGARGFLSKPLRQDSLRAAIAECDLGESTP